LVLTYALAFVNIGIFWTNHHHMLATASQVNGRALWANLFLLFWLTLMPFVIRWKGHLAEGKTDRRPIIQLDVLPTVLAAAGVSPQPQWKLDGVNLLPFLKGGASGTPHDVLYWRLGDNMAIRAGDWKLVKTRDGPLGGDPSVLNDLSGAGLYNLAQDIGETKNVAGAYPDKVKALADAWQRWNKELAKPLWAPGRGGGRPPAPSKR